MMRRNDAQAAKPLQCGLQGESGVSRDKRTTHSQRDCREFRVHPHQVVQWKKQALEALPDAFSRRRVREAPGEEALKAQLYQQIGQLKVKLDWLKKKVGLSA